MSYSHNSLDKTIKILIILILLVALTAGCYYAVTNIIDNVNQRSVERTISDLEKKVIEKQSILNNLSDQETDLRDTIVSEIDTFLKPNLSEIRFKYWHVMISYDPKGFMNGIDSFKKSDEYKSLTEKSKSDFNNCIKQIRQYITPLEDISIQIGKTYDEIQEIENEINMASK